jgi:glycerophosphoryl diester phosphodiesterase
MGSIDGTVLDTVSRGTPPLVIAHRAGNRLDVLHAAERAGVRLIEADVRLFRGRAEVRHLKTVGPLPLYWDKWEVAAPWRKPLLLGALLEATSPTTELMLDLKGPRRRLAELVLHELRPYLGRRRFTISARRWDLLDAFDGAAVRCVHSVGSTRQLRSLLRRSQRRPIAAVAVHERLLDAAIVDQLHGLAAIVLTWPVNRIERAAELVRMGVDGLITDESDQVTREAVLGALA